MALNERVEEIVWKIRTLDADELALLRERLGAEFAIPHEPDELSTREPVRTVPSANDVVKR